MPKSKLYKKFPDLTGKKKYVSGTVTSINKTGNRHWIKGERKDGRGLSVFVTGKEAERVSKSTGVKITTRKKKKTTTGRKKLTAKQLKECNAAARRARNACRRKLLEQ